MPLPEVSQPPAETALQATSALRRGDRLSQHDALGRDGELADLGFVVARAGLEHRERALDGGGVAYVLQEHDVVGEVGDAELREAGRAEQVEQLQVMNTLTPWRDSAG